MFNNKNKQIKNNIKMENLTAAERNKQRTEVAFLIGVLSGILFVDYLFDDEKN